MKPTTPNILMAGALFLGACSSSEASMESVAEAAIDEYAGTYGCEISTSLVIDDLEIESPFSQIGRVVLGTAEPGLVFLDPDLIELEKTVDGVITHSAIHEASHACNVGEVLFDESIQLDSGMTFIGAQGFVAIGLAPSGERLTFTLIDEGAAEALSTEITDITAGGFIGDAAKTTNELRAARGITLSEMQDMQESSDLIGFIAALHGIERDQLTPDHIQSILNMYLEGTELN